MRALLLVLLLAVPSIRAAESQSISRNAAYERIRDSANVSKQVKKTGELIQSGELDAALALAEEALRTEPGNAETLNAKAAVLIEMGKYDDAAELLAEAERIAPDFLVARFNHAEALLLQKNYWDAAYEFLTLHRNSPENSLIKFKLYIAYHLAGRDDLAEQFLESMRYPIDGPAWYYSHAAEDLLNDEPKKARRLMKAARAIHPDEAGQYDRALQKIGLLD